jgi:hypothetical protein
MQGQLELHVSASLTPTKQCWGINNKSLLFNSVYDLALLAHNYCMNCHESKNGSTECNGCDEDFSVSMK